MYRTETEVVDPVSDLDVLTAGCYEDPSVADALREMYECEAAIADADLEAMHAAAQADGLDVAPWHDLTGERWAQIIAMCPENTGWGPEVAYTAGDELPYRAQLRRGTPNGPDMVRLASFSSPENALTAAVLFLVNMVLADKYGDEQAKDVIRRQIQYAPKAG